MTRETQDRTKLIAKRCAATDEIDPDEITRPPGWEVITVNGPQYDLCRRCAAEHGAFMGVCTCDTPDRPGKITFCPIHTPTCGACVLEAPDAGQKSGGA